MTLMKNPRFLLNKIFCLLIVFYSHSILAIEVGDYLQLGKLQSIQGQSFDESDWAKRNTLVQIWATWCGYCHQQNNNLDQLSKKISPDSMNVITISVDRRIEPVISYLKDHQYAFPVVMMDARLSSAIGKRRGVPELYILDRDGRVIQKDFGLMVNADFFDLAKYAKTANTSPSTNKLTK
jgi:thiol-disulfide isomerase/thioredoxin